MAVELPEWECKSAHQLHANLLKASKDQAKAYLITDLRPNIIDFDIDTSVLKNDQWYELMDEITKLNEIREQVASNALEQIEFASDGRIFSVKSRAQEVCRFRKFYPIVRGLFAGPESTEAIRRIRCRGA